MAAVLLIAAATAARFSFITSGQLDLVQDEAQYWDWSRRLQLSYYSKGPLIAWLIAAFTGVFGDTELGVRFGAAAGSLAVQVVLYLGLARLLRKPRLAVLTLFILNTTPLFLASGILMTTDNPLLVCWITALFCLHATVLRPEARWPWAGLGISMALGVLAKYTMLGMAGVAVLHALMLWRHGILPQGHWRKLGAALGAGSLIGLLPIVIWNAGNEWASFRHVGRLAGIAPAAGDPSPALRPDRFVEYLGGQIGLVLPWWLGFMLYGGGRTLAHWARRVPREAARERREVAEDALWCAAFWPIFLFFMVWSLHARVYANWPAMAYAAGVVLAAKGVDAVLEKYRQGADLWQRSAEPVPLPWSRRLLPVWAGLSVAICLVMYAQQPISQVLPEQANPAARLKGWSDLGRRVDELRAAMPDPDKVFIFSDAYDVTAELAFYVPGKPVVFCSDFGRRRNQYDFWPGPVNMVGWDAVFVRRKPFDRPPEVLRDMFQEIGAPEDYASTHRGGPGRRFGILVLRGFTGKWPRTSQRVY